MGAAVLMAALMALGGVGADSTESQENPGLAKVDYFTDSVWECDDDVIKLLGGSIWLMGLPVFVLVTQDVTIVLTNEDVGIAFIEGDQITVRHLSGEFVAKQGWLGEVIEEMGDGAVLRLNDGSLWEVPEYDRFDTGWWLPPYPVVVTSNELYMINLKKGKRLWVNRMK